MTTQMRTMMKTDEILTERGTRYGKFIDQTKIINDLMTVLHGTVYDTLETDQKEALHQIVVKISRILNGDPDYEDNWSDIAGYAQLVEKRLNGEEI
jgi:hypothetical protein